MRVWRPKMTSQMRRRLCPSPLSEDLMLIPCYFHTIVNDSGSECFMLWLKHLRKCQVIGFGGEKIWILVNCFDFLTYSILEILDRMRTGLNHSSTSPHRLNLRIEQKKENAVYLQECIVPIRTKCWGSRKDYAPHVNLLLQVLGIF